MQPHFVAPALLIDQRPGVVEEQTRIGDWERVLITGRATRSAIGTLADRTSLFVRLIHLPDGRCAEQLRVGPTASMVDLPAEARRTLTWDQGSEMACHDQVANLFIDGTFFAHPGRPWERPLSENTSGLLRQHFPKSTDLFADTMRVEDLKNATEERCLGVDRRESTPDAASAEH